jgi:ABC-type polysaccharide/polyol phosphate transport system ATPase subunit
VTTNSPYAIRAEQLTKVYRLYRKPGFRFLDILSLCPRGERYYTEHAALDHVDFQIARGEKVAIIGRNGAGKSTLLRMISGLLRPSSGLIDVQGTIKALLDIGSGFYPDFSGRENVLSALAYQGIAGRAAHEKLDEILEFAELEEYIDQPMRTYSTGMMMRLMFATATCVEPDILVADEVLGVGDAYFAHKSFERVKRLVRARGTTFLLVTHNIYSALEVCERFVWLDHGRIMLDGPGTPVIAAYEQSIKEQEEQRQHRAKVRAAAAALGTPRLEGITVRFAARDAYRPDGPLYVAKLAAVWPDGRRIMCVLAPNAVAAVFRALPAESVNASTYLGRECLVLREYGDIFHKLDCWLSLSKGEDLPASLEVEYAFDGPGTLTMGASSDGDTFVDIAALGTTRTTGWHKVTADIPQLLAGERTRKSKPRSFGRYGTADVTLEDLRLFDDAGECSLLLRHGGSMRIEFDYLVRNPSGVTEIVAAVGMHRDGYLPIAFFVSTPFTPGTGRGTVTLAVDNLRLTNGEYSLAVGLIRPEILRTGAFFSMSPDVFDHHPRVVSFRVIGDEQPQAGWTYVQEGKWTVHPERC